LKGVGRVGGKRGAGGEKESGAWVWIRERVCVCVRACVCSNVDQAEGLEGVRWVT
jgi:hypothetical protein